MRGEKRFLPRVDIAGIVELTPDQEYRADVNRDSDINMKDVLLLRRMSAGIE